MSNCAMRMTVPVQTTAITGAAAQAHSTRLRPRNRAQFAGTSTNRYTTTTHITNERLGISTRAAFCSDSRAAAATGLKSFHAANPGDAAGRIGPSNCTRLDALTTSAAYSASRTPVSRVK